MWKLLFFISWIIATMHINNKYESWSFFHVFFSNRLLAFFFKCKVFLNLIRTVYVAYKFHNSNVSLVLRFELSAWKNNRVFTEHYSLFTNCSMNNKYIEMRLKKIKSYRTGRTDQEFWNFPTICLEFVILKMDYYFQLVPFISVWYFIGSLLFAYRHHSMGQRWNRPL